MIFSVIFFSVGLVACNSENESINHSVNNESYPGQAGADKIEIKESNYENIKQTEISNEVKNEDFKLIVKSEKQNFSIDEPIKFITELYYIGSDQEVTVYPSAGLISYHILSKDGTFELKSEGEDSRESFVIQKNQPYITTFEFDKKDEGFGSLLESLGAGNYIIKIQVSYGIGIFLNEKYLATELNFKISE